MYYNLSSHTALFSTMCEWLSANLGQGPTYDYLMKIENSNKKFQSFKSLELILTLVVAMICFVQIRIELEKRKLESPVTFSEEIPTSTG